MPGFSPFSISPLTFPEDCVFKIKRSLVNIFSFEYTHDVSNERQWWRDWEVTWCPENNSAVDYVASLREKNLPYHVPMRFAFFNKDCVMSMRWDTVTGHSLHEVDESNVFNFPYIHATAQPSVESEFCPHPPEPRLYRPKDVLLQADIDEYNARTQDFFDGCVGSRVITIEDFKKIIRRSVSYTCDVIPFTGSAVVKKSLVSKLQHYTVSFVTALHRNLDTSEQFLVKRWLLPASRTSELDEEVCQVNGVTVIRKYFRNLRPGECISESLMQAFMNLFGRRDYRVVRAHVDKMSRRSNYELLHSLFYNADFFRSVQQPVNARILPSWQAAHRVYITMNSDDGKWWSLLFLEIESKCLYYIDPRRVPVSVAELQQFETILNPVIGLTGLDVTVPWKCQVYPYQFFEPIASDNHVDSGMYVVAIMYYLCAPAPVAFRANDIGKLRNIFAYYMLNGDLPF